MGWARILIEMVGNMKVSGEKASDMATELIRTLTVKSMLESGRGTKEMAMGHTFFRMVKNMLEDGKMTKLGSWFSMTHRAQPWLSPGFVLCSTEMTSKSVKLPLKFLSFYPESALSYRTS